MVFKREDYITDNDYTEKQIKRQEEAFYILNLGASHEPVYGGEYKAMKECISRVFEASIRSCQRGLHEYFANSVTKIDVNGITYQTEPDEISDMFYKFPNLTQLTGFIKYLDKMSNEYKDNPYYVALHKTAEKWSEVGLVVKEMKDSVIKGKRPPAVKSEATKMREALDAEKKTCPCCIAKFMVKKDGTMVHHGYKRPGLGFDIGECQGAQRFKPLEVSLDGTYHMVNFFQEKKEEFRKALDELPNQKELTAYINNFNNKTHRYEKVAYQVTPEHKALWKQTYKKIEENLLSNIQGSDKMVKFYQDVMKNNFNKTYPKDNPSVAEERKKYLGIIQSFDNNTGINNSKGIVY